VGDAVTGDGTVGPSAMDVALLAVGAVSDKPCPAVAGTLWWLQRHGHFGAAIDHGFCLSVTPTPHVSPLCKERGENVIGGRVIAVIGCVIA
jgi:hypothetical protein